jgi:hypothetical protein
VQQEGWLAVRCFQAVNGDITIGVTAYAEARWYANWSQSAASGGRSCFDYSLWLRRPVSTNGKAPFLIACGS